jgi:50S ribosomal subunit-associated GTPase HflX
MGIAANKSDLIENEEISENEAREYAKEIKAIFRVTSASTSSGIEELFRIIGCKILDPYYTEEEGEEQKNTEKPKQVNIEKTIEKKDENKIKLDNNKNTTKKKKKKCC